MKAANFISRAMLAGFSLAAFSTSAFACQECQAKKSGTFLGQFTILGNGTVRTWVKKNDAGKPVSMGVTFSETALDGLPTKMPAGMPAMEYKLALPAQAAGTGFDHISLDWNPQGHPPTGIYDKPHFDIHFYMVNQQALDKITAKDTDLARTEKKPEARFIPTGYIMPPGTAIPKMGAHAVDTAAPELAGKPFEASFIYGYYDGLLTFLEPMATIEYLKTKPNFKVPVKTPAAYAKPGFYPTSYSITHDESRKEITVALEGLTWRTGIKAPLKPAPKKIAKAK